MELDEFTTKVLNEKLFHCSACDNLLKAPIILVENVGNMCLVCAEKKKESHTTLHNKSLEAVLVNLKFPCKFQINGCDYLLPYKELEEHESDCKYFMRQCESLTNFKCAWKGVLCDFWEHFKNEHSDNVLKRDSISSSKSTYFKIPINITENCYYFKLLHTNKEVIMLKLEYLKDTDCLKYVLLGDNSEDQKTVKYFDIESDNVVITRVKVQPLKKLYFNNELNYTFVNLNTVKQIIEIGENFLIGIKIKPIQERNELDYKMLQYFECPVCKTLMKPPIFQCNYGHSLCNTCKPKLEKCPTCRGLFGSIRNFSLEGLTSLISYPCQYQYLGCNETASNNEINKHEEECKFKSYPCPAINCGFCGNSISIISHLKSVHKDQIIYDNYYKTTVDFRAELFMDFFETQRLFMMFDEKLFRLCFKKNCDYCFWAVEHLHGGGNKNFVYEVGIIDMRKPNRKLIRVDDCFKGVNTEDMFKKSILFPNNILASYSINGNLTYYCKIYQADDSMN